MTVKGVKTPITFGGSGGLLTVSDDKKIGQNLKEIVLTRLGSRVMEPEVGSAATLAIQRNPDSAHARASLSFTITQLKKEESRAIINSQSVVINTTEIQSGNSIVITVPWLWKEDATIYTENVEV